MKPKEQTKPNEDKSNNQSKATIIFNDLINKRKNLMSELYNSDDYNNLKFEFVGPTKDVIFCEYMDSKELFNAIKNNWIKFSDVKDKQNNFLNKLNEVKIGNKIINKVINFFRDYIEMLMQITMQSKMKLREQNLKY